MLAATTLASGLNGFLQKTYPDQWWWDILRYLCALMSAALTLAYARIAFGAHRPTERQETITIRIGIMSYMAALIPSALTEVASIGTPIVPWRLPCYLVMNFFGWWYVKRRL